VIANLASQPNDVNGTWSVDADGQHCCSIIKTFLAVTNADREIDYRGNSV